MSSERNRRMVRPANDTERVAQADHLLAMLDDAAGKSDIPEFVGHDHARLAFQIECAQLAALDLDLVHGAPAVILARRGDGTVTSQPGTWTGLGNYPRDVQAIIDQLLMAGRVPKPIEIQLGMLDDGRWSAQVQAAPSKWFTRTGAVTPAMALLPCTVKYLQWLASERINKEARSR